MNEFFRGTPLVFPSLSERIADDTSFERYLIKHHAHQAPYFNAYLARDRRAKRDVWLKVLAPEFSQIPELYSYLKRVARQDYIPLQHRNILPLLKVGLFDGAIYIARPYLEGQSAQDHLKQFGSFGVLNVQTILQKLIPVLRHMHEKGLAHLNLKPSNIILDSTGDPFLADAGLTPILDVAARSLLGTAKVPLNSLFASPEQLRDRDPGAPSDIYSLGSVLYTLLTGNTPFTALDANDLFEKQYMSTVPNVQEMLTDVPDDLARCIAVALSFSRAGRFDSITEMVAELTDAVPINLSLNEIMLPRAEIEQVKLDVAPVAAAVDLSRTDVDEQDEDVDIWDLLESELTKSVQEYQPIPFKETATLMYQQHVAAVREQPVTAEIVTERVDPVPEIVITAPIIAIEDPTPEPEVRALQPVKMQTAPLPKRRLGHLRSLFLSRAFVMVCSVCLAIGVFSVLLDSERTVPWALSDQSPVATGTVAFSEADHGPKMSAIKAESVQPPEMDPKMDPTENPDMFSVSEGAKVVVSGVVSESMLADSSAVVIPVTGNSADAVFSENVLRLINQRRTELCGAGSELTQSSVLGRAAALRNADMVARGYWSQKDLLDASDVLRVEAALTEISDGNAFLFGGDNPDFGSLATDFTLGSENLLLIDGHHDIEPLATIVYDAWLSSAPQMANVDSCYWRHSGLHVESVTDCEFLMDGGAKINYETCTLVTQLFAVNAPYIP